jgi:hypothetical protein
MIVVNCIELCSIIVLSLRIVTGGVLDVIFEWKELDFAYPNSRARQQAVESQSFIPSNNVPVGLEVWKNKLFITVPRWKRGVPASLAYVYLNQTGKHIAGTLYWLVMNDTVALLFYYTSSVSVIPRFCTKCCSNFYPLCYG